MKTEIQIFLVLLPIAILLGLGLGLYIRKDPKRTRKANEFLSRQQGFSHFSLVYFTVVFLVTLRKDDPFLIALSGLLLVLMVGASIYQISTRRTR
jgi:hypothetical protein